MNTCLTNEMCKGVCFSYPSTVSPTPAPPFPPPAPPLLPFSWSPVTDLCFPLTQKSVT